MTHWGKDEILDTMTGRLWAALCKRSIAKFRAEHGIEPEDDRKPEDRFMTGDALKAWVDATGGKMPGVGQA